VWPRAYFLQLEKTTRQSLNLSRIFRMVTVVTVVRKAKITITAAVLLRLMLRWRTIDLIDRTSARPYTLGRFYLQNQQKIVALCPVHKKSAKCTIS
jgi:hypothetical protein